MFTVQELATAVQHGINTVTIVFNDGGYGNVRRTQKLKFQGHYLCSDLKNPDFMVLAKSFGAVGMRASSPAELETLLPQAINAQETSHTAVRPLMAREGSRDRLPGETALQPARFLLFGFEWTGLCR